MGKHPPGTDVGGRPTKYVKQYDDIVCNYIRENKTMEDIARLLSIDVSTVYDWQATKPSFSEAIKRGRSQLLDKIEYNLYERASGIEFKEKKKIVEGKQDATGKIKEGSKVRIEEVTKWLPPDVGACCFLLKTQRPEKYQERQNINISQMPIIIDDVPDEEGD